MRCPALAVLGTMLLLPLDALPQEAIGYAEWILPETRGLPPGAQVDRALVTFSPVMADEEVSTALQAAGDFVFERNARLLVGPDCRVTLSETIYDPRLDPVTTLALYSRVVCVVRTGESGGTIIIETPIATITIREAGATIGYATAGGSQFQVAGAGFPLVVANNGGWGGTGGGTVEVDSNIDGGTASMARPGFVIYVDDDGAVFGPIRTPPDLLASLDSTLEGLATVEPTQRPDLAPDFLEIVQGRDDLLIAEPFFDDICRTTSFCDTTVVDIEELDDDIVFPGGVSPPTDVFFPGAAVALPPGSP